MLADTPAVMGDQIAAWAPHEKRWSTVQIK